MKRHCTSTAAAVAMFLLAAIVRDAHSQEMRPTPVVYVHGEQTGQGMTRLDQGDCFVIAPDHVVRGDPPVMSPDSVYIIGTGGKIILLEPVFPRESFHILRVPRESRDICMKPPSTKRVTRALATVSQSGARGTLSQGLSDGTPAQDPVTIYPLDEAHLRIAREESVEIHTGISGSLLFLDDRPYPVGMVVQTSPDQAAAVYRLDHLEDIVGRYFRYRIRPSTGDILLSVAVPGWGQLKTQRWRWAAFAVGGTGLVVWGSQKWRDTRTEIRVHQPDPLVPPQQSPYQVREYRFRNWESVVAVWLGGGVISAAETVLFVNREYRTIEGAKRTASPRAAVRFTPQFLGEGGMGAGLSVELRF